MSFDFNNINPMKAQAAYKDGGGMGGGGMYMRQRKKRKEDKDDIFEHSEDKDTNDFLFCVDEDKKNEISMDKMFNKFVNWFRLKKST